MPVKTVSEEERATKAAYMKIWRAANKERREAYRKVYQAAHPEIKRKSDRNYYQKIKTDPEKWMARQEYTKRLQSKSRYKEWKAEYAKKRAQIPEIKSRHALNARKHYQNKSKEERKAIVIDRADYQREYREKKRNYLREYHQKLHAANREERNAISRARYQRNPLEYIQRARKRMGYLTGTYTNVEIQNLYEAQRGICPGCNSELNGKYEIDHVMPLALDPTGDRLDNLQLLCKPCNRSKHAMHPDDWAKKIGKLFI